MKNHSFPKTYTTAGAAYRAKKTYKTRFPEQDFSVVKEDGKYILSSSSVEVKQEVVSTPQPKKKAVVSEFDDEPSYMDLDETRDLFDEDDGTFYEVFPNDGWED